MKYLTLGQLLYSGLNKNTQLTIKNRYDKVIITTTIQGLNKLDGVDDYFLGGDIYEIQATGIDQLTVKLDIADDTLMDEED
jgi:hypothetical protein